MQVNNNSIDKVSISGLAKSKQNSATSKNNSSGDSASVAGGDTSSASVDISKESKLLSRGIDVARATDLTNDEKISRIKELIQQGKYRADTGKIVDNMIKEHSLTDSL